MKQLNDILKNVEVLDQIGSSNVSIQKIDFDSRLASHGSLFVAQKGVAFDGHTFIDRAIGAGAVAVVCEDLPEKRDGNITYIVVEDTHLALAKMAANFYGNPSTKLKLIGVTGTNGKTTIATLLYELFSNAGYKAGLLSTIKILIAGDARQATHTTPDSLMINRMLFEMVEAGVSHCFMEVSSHGIDQKRTAGLEFDGGIFTNLSHDHLDYHKDFITYRDVKKSFFDNLSETAFALVNLDDRNGQIMLQNTKARKVSYALKTMADYKAKILESEFSGMFLSINTNEVWTKLIGRFNAYNLLAVYGVARLLGMDTDEALIRMSELQSVDGRFQHFTASSGKTVVIDYAHTPDALQNVLESIIDIKSKNQQIITVVGCGGDRDKAKRPLMGKIAAQLSAQVIFTSDNPRYEDPARIIEDMEAGLTEAQFQQALSIIDRSQAIRTAVKIAKPEDIILIAGKGHENYQEIHGERSYFDDFETVTNILKAVEN